MNKQNAVSFRSSKKRRQATEAFTSVKLRGKLFAAELCLAEEASIFVVVTHQRFLQGVFGWRAFKPAKIYGAVLYCDEDSYFILA